MTGGKTQSTLRIFQNGPSPDQRFGSGTLAQAQHIRGSEQRGHGPDSRPEEKQHICEGSEASQVTAQVSAEHKNYKGVPVQVRRAWPSPRQSQRHTNSMVGASPPTLEPPLSMSGWDEAMGEGEATTWFGLPFDSLVHPASPLSDPFTPFSPVYRGRGAGADADVATLYFAASLMSVSHRDPHSQPDKTEKLAI
jgi:hypothetical protein